jgi:hypothetical protein
LNRESRAGSLAIARLESEDDPTTVS